MRECHFHKPLNVSSTFLQHAIPIEINTLWCAGTLTQCLYKNVCIHEVILIKASFIKSNNADILFLTAEKV